MHKNFRRNMTKTGKFEKIGYFFEKGYLQIRIYMVNYGKNHSITDNRVIRYSYTAKTKVRPFGKTGRKV